MALITQALTDYQTVANWLSLSGSTDQALIETMINAASRQIATWCGRTLVYTVFTTTRPDKVATYGGPKLRLSVFPLATGATVNTEPADGLHGCVDQVTLLNQPETPGQVYTVPSDEWAIDGQTGAAAGILYRSNGWPNSGLLRPDLNFQRQLAPGTEERSCWVAYAGGWLTSPQAQGTNGQAWAYPAPNTTPPLGQLYRQGSTNLWQCVVKGPLSATPPAFPATPTIGDQVVDGGATWVFLGTQGAPGARGTALLQGTPQGQTYGLELPDDLEQACIELVKSVYLERFDNARVKQESLGDYSASYDRTTSLPPRVEDLLRPYKRAV